MTVKRSKASSHHDRFNGAAPARARNGLRRFWPAFSPICFNGAAPARARNARLISVISALFVGFNGAAPARARNGRRPTWCRVGRCCASTGPRPRGRGMAGGGGSNGPWGNASTGPRPRGRGMLTGMDRIRSSIKASTGPRPRGRGMGAERSGAAVEGNRLQRGRARAGAECNTGASLQGGEMDASTGPRPRGRGMHHSSDCNGDSIVRLQRGRARAGAECERTVAEGQAAIALQRGRARAGAECLDLGKLFGSLVGRFNGAAPARARNAPHLYTTRLELHTASTGPRPRGRGMCKGSLVFLVLTCMLQRGRARAGAECTTILARALNLPPSLQRGRARAGAECANSSNKRLSRPSASTGPRPRGRGMPCAG